MSRTARRLTLAAALVIVFAGSWALPFMGLSLTTGDANASMAGSGLEEVEWTARNLNCAAATSLDEFGTCLVVKAQGYIALVD